jgi:hypothetical protein
MATGHHRQGGSRRSLFLSQFFYTEHRTAAVGFDVSPPEQVQAASFFLSYSPFISASTATIGENTARGHPWPWPEKPKAMAPLLPPSPARELALG